MTRNYFRINLHGGMRTGLGSKSLPLDLHLELLRAVLRGPLLVAVSSCLISFSSFWDIFSPYRALIRD